MTQRFTLSRRSFLAGTAAAGGLSLGFALPSLAQDTASAAPELNAWVVVNPDNTVVVRVAKIEMGQGTLTGLAQLVAEELECDWANVTWSYPTPGENVTRDRVWGPSAPSAARASAPRRKWCARAARRRGPCCSRLRPTAGAWTWAP